MLHKIMLIDDSEADNFIHERRIKKANVCEDIIVKYNGFSALEYLKNEANSKPDLILLDINMPGMNGWEFLEQYEALELHEKAKVVICMLTTSTSDEDYDKSKTYEEIKSFLNKPLTEFMITSIVNENFPSSLTKE